jgi:ABC-2 type transport system permease protein
MLRAFFLIKIQSVKAALQYPVNFILDVVGVSLTGFAEALVVLLLTSAFESIGGWDFWQVAFMTALWRLSNSLHQALFLGFWEHHRLVKDGGYDTLLVRPAHPIVQIIANGLPLEAFGELLPAAALFALTSHHLHILWTLGNLLFLGVVVISGALIEWAIYLFFATLDFWSSVMSKQWIPNAFLYPTSRYPLHIYGRVFASLLTFVFPYGFIAYYPAQHFLQISSGEYPAFFAYLSPLVAAVALLVGLSFWSLGLRYYQSTGT